MPRTLTQCPVCDSPLRVTQLSCARCATTLSGHFPPPPLARLPGEQQAFIETFVRCRGIIRDVERALGISYPTVRARLDAAVAALEAVLAADAQAALVQPLPPTPPDAPSAPVIDDPAREARRREILESVGEGVLDAAAAADALRRL